MKKNPYLTFSLVAGGIFVAYLFFKKKNGMVIPQNVDVEKAKPSSSGSGGGGSSAPRMSAPSMPIITPPVVVIPQTTNTSTGTQTQITPLSQTTAGAPTRTMIDNPDQDRVLGGAIVPPTTTTIQTSSGTLAVKTEEPKTPAPPALGKSGGMAG